MNEPFRVPDALFPCESVFDIPQLKPELQAEFVDLPVSGWGSTSRKDRMRGTWHFYVDDEKFNRLWKHPETLLKTKAIGAVEVNFSTNDQMPFAVGIYRIFQKRWLSRYWQSYGMPLWVDLNVSSKFEEYNLIGVPRKWRPYATHAVDSRIDTLMHHADLADLHSKGSFDMLVYGGSKGVAKVCEDNGWVHIRDARLEARDGSR